jgi:cytochrome c biogenesis protein
LQENNEKQNRNPTSILNKIKRFFISLKLALILILILVGLCLVGAFLIQVPSNYTQNSEMYHYWLETIAQPATGPWYPVLNVLGFFNIFHSIWFLGAGSLLIVSIVVCTLNRWKQIKANISQKTSTKKADYLLSTDNSIVISSTLNPEAVFQRVLKVFRKNRYSIKESNFKTDTYIIADKNRYSPLGTYLIHLSLILFIVGFLVGSYLGFRETSFTVAEGETKPVGYGTQLSLKLDSFKDEYWDNGSPKDYSSQVVIYDNGQIVKRDIVRVNHPLSYNGIRFYQSFFGDAAIIQLSDAQGNTLYQGSVLLSQTIEDYPYLRQAGYLQIDQSQLQVYIIGRATNMQDDKLSDNQLAIQVYQNGSNQPLVNTVIDKGIPLKTDQINITYSAQAKYSGFQVSRDPGNNLIWIASSLFLLGLVMVFYFPRRQILTLVEPDSRGIVKLSLHSGVGRKIGTESNLQKLANELKNELQDEAKILQKENKG